MSATETLSKVVVHKAGSRGKADFGWLQARSSFSFGRWFHPERVHFGKLRVLQDDIIAAGAGFGTHPHDNMEIVTIPLKGGLAHEDSTGGKGVIMAGDVQMMSAGTGVTHSEFNASETEEARTLQIWVFPKEKNIMPRYDQKRFDPVGRQNKIQLLVHPTDPSAVRIHQDAVFARTDLDAGKEVTYTPLLPENGIYAFVLEGEVTINGHELSRRDALGIEAPGDLKISASTDAQLLLIDVPMR